MSRSVASLVVAAIVVMGARTTSVIAAGDLTVTASYKGKGTVDDEHDILVFLFDHPVPTAGSVPLALWSITRNGGAAAFKNVAADTVYVVVVYDEKANYDGRSGPPPAGHPIGTYSRGGTPVPVKPGTGAKVAVTFDDSHRWAQ